MSRDRYPFWLFRVGVAYLILDLFAGYPPFRPGEAPNKRTPSFVARWLPHLCRLVAPCRAGGNIPHLSIEEEGDNVRDTERAPRWLLAALISGGDAVSLEIGGPRSPDSPEQPRRRGVPPIVLGLPIRAWQQAFVLGVDELARLCNGKKAFFSFQELVMLTTPPRARAWGILGKDQGRETRVFLRPAGPRRLLNITRRATATVMGVGYGYGGRRSGGGGHPRNSGTRQQVRGCLSCHSVFPNSAPVPSASGQINNDQRARMGQPPCPPRNRGRPGRGGGASPPAWPVLPMLRKGGEKIATWVDKTPDGHKQAACALEKQT